MGNQNGIPLEPATDAATNNPSLAQSPQATTSPSSNANVASARTQPIDIASTARRRSRGNSFMSLKTTSPQSPASPLSGSLGGRSTAFGSMRSPSAAQGQAASRVAAAQAPFAGPASAPTHQLSANSWISSLKNNSSGKERQPGSISALFGKMAVKPRLSVSENDQGRDVEMLDREAIEAIEKEFAEKHFLNSAKIVHNYGVGGIAPLAPLSQKKENVIPVMVSWNGGGRVVYITGTFNNWKQKIRLTKSKADFSTVIDMPAGETHRFKFIVDDEWKCSDDLPIASDAEGNVVNYLEVVDEFGDGIHDGFEGLAHQDGIESPVPDSPESSYASNIPQYLSWHLENQNQQHEQTQSLSSSGPGTPQRQSSTPPPLPTEPPPHLPPHLEKVFLNLPVPVTSHRDDNLILPTPNPVTLNHLYACSIRDGVMALSCTTRYKEKYVTTILYKPVVDEVA